MTFWLPFQVPITHTHQPTVQTHDWQESSVLKQLLVALKYTQTNCNTKKNHVDNEIDFLSDYRLKLMCVISLQQ